MIRITEKWLAANNACDEGVAWWRQYGAKSLALTVERLIEAKKYDWVDWLFRRIFTKRQAIQYAIFAAEQVLKIYERVYPDDKRPRLAAKAAKAVLKKDTAKNRAAARAAAAAATAPTNVDRAIAAHAAAYAARAAAHAAAYAARAAVQTAAVAARTASYDAAAAATNAAFYHRDAAKAAEVAMKDKLCRYGLTLLCKTKE